MQFSVRHTDELYTTLCRNRARGECTFPTQTFFFKTNLSERGVCPRGIFYPWVRWDRGLANFRNCFPAAPASVTNISDFDNFARTRKNRSDKIMLFLDQTPMWNWSTSEVSTTPRSRILRSPHQKFKKPGKAEIAEHREI